jgi:DNA-directed RNA polymerase subunit M/transcription elongation factor TFIIS
MYPQAFNHPPVLAPENLGVFNYAELADQLDEYVVEYNVNIDSIDRDVDTYPDPFCFRVTFKPNSSSFITRRSRTNTGNKFDPIKTINEQVKVDGTPGPTIPSEFRNIKYIKLEKIILPKFTSIEKVIDDDTDEIKYIPDLESSIMNDRYVIMNIKELSKLNMNSTNDKVANSFGLIYIDKEFGQQFVNGYTYSNYVHYKQSKLGNLKTMTISFCDSCGNPLKFDHLDYDVELDLPCTKNKNRKIRRVKHSELTDTESYVDTESVVSTETSHKKEESGKNEEPKCKCKKCYIRHPLNPKHQVLLSFKVGVVESQLETKTEYMR